jgi:phosphinothricin acetyltransferase
MQENPDIQTQDELQIRLAEPQDAAEIRRIYQPYVTDSAITLVSKTPTIESIAQTMQMIKAQYPYLVCTKGDMLIGFAYATTLRPHDAYRWNAELSIYLDERFHRLGIASALYTALLHILQSQGYVNLYAIITLPNESSIALHRRFGFKDIGIHYKAGFKLGEWRDVAWLHHRIEDAIDPAVHGLPTSIQELRKNDIDTALGMATAMLRGVRS